MLCSTLALVFLTSLQLPFFWSQSKPEREKVFLIPGDDIAVVIACQPDCPIAFVNPRCFGFLQGGGGGQIYQIQNRGAKAIKGYTLAILNSSGGLTERTAKPRRHLQPEETTPRSLDDWNLDIVPLTDQIREKLRVDGHLKGLTLFMIVSVEFADGSTYDARSEYESLKTFLKDNPIPFEDDKKKGRD